MFTAIIPVKAKSSRLPGKNTLPFGDSNLLIHKIRQLKQVDEISEIIVSSDSPAMLEMATLEKVRAEKRPDDLADESRPLRDFVCYAASLVHTTHFMWTPVTTPFLDRAFYSLAIKQYLKALDNQYDSLTTTLPFKSLLLDEKGPFNFNPDLDITNSQDAAPMDLWTCGCSIITRELALRIGHYFGSKLFRMEVTPYQAIDIDNTFDYEVAKAMWNIYGIKK
ncbi:MAG: hypothetical protein FWG02_09025 [Holophagaceae bacterium]|nr:hypothetical protein [Holophagaceae bacterium]